VRLLGQSVQGWQWQESAATTSSALLAPTTLPLSPPSHTDKDAADLDRLRRLLCIQADVVASVARDTAGRAYGAALDAALAIPPDAFSDRDVATVASARAAVRLDAGVAREVLAEKAKKTFLGYISRSRTKRSREEAGRELRNLVIFSNVIVAPLLQDAGGVAAPAAGDAATSAADVEAAKKEIAEIMAEATKDEPKPAVDTAAAPLSKADAAAARGGGGAARPGRPAARDAGLAGQKAITLADDMERKDRVEVYRQFLLFCLSGEEVKQPFGGTVVLERDPIEFTRLQQLGDVLGLGPLDLAGVQGELAETAFRNQAQQALAGGVLGPGAAARLEDVRQKMGLSKEAADKILKSVAAEKAVGGLQAAQRSGALTLRALLDMKDSGVDLATAVNPELRLSLYTQEVASALSSGRGDLDADRILRALPADLGLDATKASAAVKTLVTEKRRLTLVQAVAHLRQRDVGAAVASANNLLSMEAALPAGAPLEWTPKAELDTLYAAYAARVSDAGKRAGVRALLGVDDAAAATLEAGGAGADPLTGVAADEEDALF